MDQRREGGDAEEREQQARAYPEAPERNHSSRHLSGVQGHAQPRQSAASATIHPNPLCGARSRVYGAKATLA
jgi:hypothetical protein